MKSVGVAASILLLVAGSATLAAPAAAQPEEAQDDHAEPDAGPPGDAQSDDGGTQAPSGACTQEPHECARQAFAAGVDAFQASDWPTALAQFREAYRLRPHPAVALNLALAEMRSNLYLEAAEHLRGILQHAEASDGLKENAQRELDNATRSLAVLQLDVASNADVVATLDGTRMPGQPPSVSLNPGRYTLEVRSTNRLVLRRTVQLGVGEKLRIAVEVAREVKMVVPTTGPTATAPSPNNKLDPVWLLGSAGLTTLLGVATVWSGLNTRRAFDDYERELPKLSQEEINRRVEEGNDKELRTNLLIGATSLAATGTAVLGLFFTDWGTRDETGRASLTVGPTGVGLHGWF